MKGLSGRTGAVVVCLVALLVILHGFSLEQRRMIGDEEGHDPGTRALPLASGAVMLAAGLYQILRPRPAKERPPAQAGGVRVLFLATLGASVAYILLLEWVGFVLLTTLFMYLLFVLNGRAAMGGAAFRISPALCGAGVAAMAAAVLYTAGRLVSRELFYLGRDAGIGFLSSRTGSVLFFILASGLLFFPSAMAAHRWGRKRSGTEDLVVNSVILSNGTTLFLFVVFRMMFRVTFPSGLLFW